MQLSRVQWIQRPVPVAQVGLVALLAVEHCTPLPIIPQFNDRFKVLVIYSPVIVQVFVHHHNHTIMMIIEAPLDTEIALGIHKDHVSINIPVGSCFINEK
jgi:hypothetical protein